MSATCRYCGKPVVWAVDENGTKQILDPKPPIYLYRGGTCERMTPVRDAVGIHENEFMVSHWSTCTKAAEVKRDQQTKGANP